MQIARIAPGNAMKRWWWLTAGLSLALLGRLAVLDRTLIAPGADFGILSLQFAGSPAALERVRELWVAREVLGVARESLRTDFLFIAAYVGNFVLGCLLLAGERRRGRVMVGAAIGIAVLDTSENLVQLHLLANGVTARVAALNAVCVTGKFLLVVLVVSFLLTAWYQQRRRPPSCG